MNLINQAVLDDVERFVFTSSIAVYGAGQVPMSEYDGPGAGGPVWDLEVRGRARPRRGAQHVRPRLHDLPASQRLRRAPEHCGPLPQRDRDLHEQRAPGEADAGVRRRPPDARVLPHRRRGAGHRPLPARAGVGERVYNIGADTPYTILELASRRSPGPSTSRRASSISQPRNEVVHAFSDHAKVRAASIPPSRSTCEPGSSAWRRGCASTARATRSTSRGDRGRSPAPAVLARRHRPLSRVRVAPSAGGAAGSSSRAA